MAAARADTAGAPGQRRPALGASQCAGLGRTSSSRPCCSSSRRRPAAGEGRGRAGQGGRWGDSRRGAGWAAATRGRARRGAGAAPRCGPARASPSCRAGYSFCLALGAIVALKARAAEVTLLHPSGAFEGEARGLENSEKAMVAPGGCGCGASPAGLGAAAAQRAHSRPAAPPGAATVARLELRIERLGPPGNGQHRRRRVPDESAARRRPARARPLPPPARARRRPGRCPGVPRREQEGNGSGSNSRGGCRRRPAQRARLTPR
jgi:hypothetical protein